MGNQNVSRNGFYDPIRAGFVTSISRPEGNVTGVNLFITVLEGKRIGLLRALGPGIQLIAVLFNPDRPTHATEVREVQEAARAIGQQMRILLASNENAINAAFATATQLPRRSDAGRQRSDEKPGDLPVVQSTKFEFVINLHTARELGIEVPPGVISTRREIRFAPMSAMRRLLMTHSGHRPVLERSPQFRLLFQT
jgi:ABC-type uncharacterized transport system substrate-binding protein